MDITLWRPRSSLSPFRYGFGDWFDDFFEREGILPKLTSEPSYRPPMESYVKGNEYHLRAEIPGIDPKDLDISLEDGHLCVSGERKRADSAEDACYCFGEMSYGKFSRCFHVPRDLDAEKVHATYDNGMLELAFPMHEPVAEKKIPIEGVKGTKKETKTA
jgi:HSP20 family protein